MFWEQTLLMALYFLGAISSLCWISLLIYPIYRISSFSISSSFSFFSFLKLLPWLVSLIKYSILSIFSVRCNYSFLISTLCEFFTSFILSTMPPRSSALVSYPLLSKVLARFLFSMFTVFFFRFFGTFMIYSSLMIYYETMFLLRPKYSSWVKTRIGKFVFG